jgi:hypothetical protein
MRRLSWDPLTIIALVSGLICALGIVLVVLWATSPPANSHQPYGGCAEGWQAPRSTGADHCRDHGWTVRKRFVIGPAGVVRYISLRPCPSEDSGNCYWDAGSRGDGRGDSFVIKGQRDGVHRIWWVRF